MRTDNILFPKVLIIGETFRLNGGGGITLINLFKNWNPENIAIVTERLNETSFNSGCKKFYRLGNQEYIIPFPFSVINRIPISGDFKIYQKEDTQRPVQPSKNIVQRIKFSIEKAYYKSLIFLGLYNASYKIVISKQLLEWIKEYSPDIIYSQPFKYSDMVFAKKLKEKTGIPLAIHLMDDSVNFLNKPNLLYYYWRKKIRNTFSQLVESADVHLSISQAMSDEYFKRYNKTFIPFRNPIEINAWEPYIKTNWSLGEEVSIIYTGRLAVPNINALFTFCQVVNELNLAGYKIKLDIYSIDVNLEFISRIRGFNSVFVHDSVPFYKIPVLITQFDIAFLPIDFTQKGIKYARYSISTKTSEYMISGVPILLFAPEHVALTEYAKKYECMYTVHTNDKMDLTKALITLIKDDKLRTSLAKKAIEIAKSDSDAITTREKFREALINV
jgi:hypothetical protein